MATRTTQYSRQIGNVSVIYNIYRIVLPLVLLVTYISTPDNTILGTLNLPIFVQVSTGYAIFGVLMTFITSTRESLVENTKFLTMTLIVDILALSLLIYSCGGTASGLGLLLIVTIAAGSILIRGRISIFLAAIATILIIYTEVYLSFAVRNLSAQFLQAGILGSILFATSIYIQTVTSRAYRAALLADEQASNIIDLEKLNDEIIQRMRTGVIVVKSDNQIVTMNSAARHMLNPVLQRHERDGKSVYLLPDMLVKQLDAWRHYPKTHLSILDLPNSNIRIQTGYAFLNDSPDSDVLIFLENHSQVMQRVQQMKLASLGRLTASIAHEVRNPLGAISHASQLLKESGTVDQSDKRMIEIILNQCNRVNGIIEHVLDASRHKEVTPSRISLEPWLKSFIESYKETHEDCDKINLKITADNVEIKVIPSQLEQVLANLFDNGLRYSRRASGTSTIDVVIEVSLENDEELPCLRVIDRGRALDSAEQALLFEPFYTTESSGTGLGLYISKELCEANRAHLTYSASDTGTSCFTIYFSDPNRVVS
ncbi:MAG: ATP-binding protein [Pseudohongiellaceae bacterium]